MPWRPYGESLARSSTSISTVGAKLRGRRRLWPPVRRLAPFAMASSTCSAMTSSCGAEVTAPTFAAPGPGGSGAGAQSAHLVRDSRDEGVVHARLDVDPLDRRADLARGGHSVVRGDGGRTLEVGVGEDDQGILAAQLEADRGEGPARPFGDGPARGGGGR